MPIDIHVTPISLSILLDLVLKLKETFSPQDIVPTKLLKQVIEVIGAEQLTDVLTDIFSTLLSQAVIFGDHLKMSHIALCIVKYIHEKTSKTFTYKYTIKLLLLFFKCIAQ